MKFEGYIHSPYLPPTHAVAPTIVSSQLAVSHTAGANTSGQYD